MEFASPLIEGRLIRRYKRFLADVDIDGSMVTAHCPNTGSMLGCAEPGSRVWLSRSTSAARKYPLTWELVELDRRTLVGIHTGRSNRLVEEAIVNGIIGELAGFPAMRREVRYGVEGSRIDLLLTAADGCRCYVEVKNVTAAVENGIALFPDAVSTRGTKHLREMIEMVKAGHRAVICFCAQRCDVREVRPADAIDPEYGAMLRKALAVGVQAIAYRADISLDAIVLRGRIPVVCPRC